MATVLLARHGETTWNRDGRIQGWAPTGLTDRGREQARALGEHLSTDHAVDRVVASDLRRTRETTRGIRSAVEAPVEFRESWRERHFGVLQGLSAEQVFDERPEFELSETGVRAAEATPEGGESLLDCRERVLGAWEDLRASLDEETLLVVTHGGPLKLLVGHLQGRDVVGSILDVETPNCGLSEVRVGEDGATRVVREHERVVP